MNVGEVVAGRFRLERELGRGGMGAVFEALQLDLRRPVALKVLHDATQLDALARFRREALVMARLDDPHAVRIYEFLEFGEGAALVMELVNGEPLDSRLKRTGLPAMDEALALLDQIAGVLDAAHALGIVHRDLKPANVMVETREGKPFARVVDFGIAALQPRPDEVLARVTRTGMIAGTASYMSPEQCRGASVDGRSDVYALACLTWELLAGRPPFDDQSTADVLAAHLYRLPEPLSTHAPARALTPAFDAAVSSALAKRPDDRPFSASRFVATLRSALTDDGKRAGKTARSNADTDAKWPIASLDDLPVCVVLGPGARVAECDMLLNALGSWGLRATRGEAGPNEKTFGAVVVLCDEPAAGLALCAEISQRNDCPVLWCVADDDVRLMGRAIAAGVFDMLVWPLEPAEAAQRVLRALRKSKR